MRDGLSTDMDSSYPLPKECAAGLYAGGRVGEDSHPGVCTNDFVDGRLQCRFTVLQKQQGC